MRISLPRPPGRVSGAANLPPVGGSPGLIAASYNGVSWTADTRPPILGVMGMALGAGIRPARAGPARVRVDAMTVSFIASTRLVPQCGTDGMLRA